MATDKSTIIKAFNNHFMEFLQDVSSIYPENSDINSAKNSFETLKKMNPSAIIKVWFNYVYSPYKDVIDAGDVSFFFEKDYSNDLSHLGNSDDILKAIEKVRRPIQSMSNENKEHTKSYLQNLSKLSAVYSSL
jgi:hypothetical protein